MKSNYFIDICLLKYLNINVKEAMVLDYFYYYGNRKVKSYKITIKKVAKLLNIARSYLYKILNGLIKRKLISRDYGEFVVA